MRAIFTAIILCILIISYSVRSQVDSQSNNNSSISNQADEKKHFKKPEEISEATAKNMYNHFKQIKNSKKSEPFSVKFNRQELIEALQESNDDSVKFFVAAYQDTVADNNKKGYPTILLQTTHHSFLTYKYYQGGSLCPPPSGCKL